MTSVLFVAGWQTPSGDFIFEHYKSIVKTGTNATYLYLEFNKSSRFFPSIECSESCDKETGLKLYNIKIDYFFRRYGVYQFLIRFAFKRFMKKQGIHFDLVHLNVRTPVTEAIGVFCKRINLPVILTEHSSFYHKGIYTLFPNKLEREKERKRIIRWFQEVSPLFVLPVSNQLGDVLISDFKVDPEIIEKIPNTVNTDEFCFSAQNREVGNKIQIFLLAFWESPKNLNLFIDALKVLDPNVLSRIEVTIGGTGSLLESAKIRLSDELPELLVSYLGHLNTKAEVIAAFRKSDLFVHPTDAENLPCVIIESLTLGVPVLSVAINGITELVRNGENGILVSPGNVNEFASGLLDFVNGKISFDNTKISESACLNFSYDKVGGMIKDIYSKVLLKKLRHVEDLIVARENYQIDSRICTKCIMRSDDDPLIKFDRDGICNYCRKYDRILSGVHKLNFTDSRFNDILTQIKRNKKSNSIYDCVLGVSGGVDSCYAAVKLKELGLNPLLVHLDNGWNSEYAVRNIEIISKACQLDLYTHVINWNEFRDIQKSFFYASVVDIELITDYAIVSSLYLVAQKKGIKFIFTGHNFSTESIMPEFWIHHKSDLENIRSIYFKFFRKRLKTFPKLGYFGRAYLIQIKGIKVIPLLNFIKYNKDDAKNYLISQFGWIDYGGKHSESVFTKYYQNYILPEKFKIDKRRAHLSSLICSGQMTRERALVEIEKPLYSDSEFRIEQAYFLKKMGFSEEEFNGIMKAPVKSHLDYGSYILTWYKFEKQLIIALRPIYKLIRRITGWRVKSNYV